MFISMLFPKIIEEILQSYLVEVEIVSEKTGECEYYFRCCRLDYSQQFADMKATKEWFIWTTRVLVWDWTSMHSICRYEIPKKEQANQWRHVAYTGDLIQMISVKSDTNAEVCIPSHIFHLPLLGKIQIKPANLTNHSFLERARIVFPKRSVSDEVLTTLPKLLSIISPTRATAVWPANSPAGIYFLRGASHQTLLDIS